MKRGCLNFFIEFGYWFSISLSLLLIPDRDQEVSHNNRVRKSTQKKTAQWIEQTTDDLCDSGRKKTAPIVL